MFVKMLLAIVLFVLIVAFISFLIDNRQFHKEIEQEQIERMSAENRLTESLKTFCHQLGIELSYHKELGTAAGRIVYYKKDGRLIVDSAKIEILERYENQPYVLAHELGHYMAIKQRQDDSERGADDEANKLCRAILNEKEQGLLSIGLDCYFGAV